jgi:Domain of unknown function (DUF4124)
MVVKQYFSYFKPAIIVLNASLFAAFIFCCAANAEGIVKWKDSNGVTHYGDKLPAQEAGRTNTVLNKQGMTPMNCAQDQNKKEFKRNKQGAIRLC